jgi:hypothetical protein
MKTIIIFLFLAASAVAAPPSEEILARGRKLVAKVSGKPSPGIESRTRQIGERSLSTRSKMSAASPRGSAILAEQPANRYIVNGRDGLSASLPRFVEGVGAIVEDARITFGASSSYGEECKQVEIFLPFGTPRPESVTSTETRWDLPRDAFWTSGCAMLDFNRSGRLIRYENREDVAVALITPRREVRATLNGFLLLLAARMNESGSAIVAFIYYEGEDVGIRTILLSETGGVSEIVLPEKFVYGSYISDEEVVLATVIQRQSLVSSASVLRREGRGWSEKSLDFPQSGAQAKWTLISSFASSRKGIPFAFGVYGPAGIPIDELEEGEQIPFQVDISLNTLRDPERIQLAPGTLASVAGILARTSQWEIVEILVVEEDGFSDILSGLRQRSTGRWVFIDNLLGDLGLWEPFGDLVLGVAERQNSLLLTTGSRVITIPTGEVLRFLR